MEFKVEARSKKTRAFIEALMPSMIKQLKLTNSRKAVLVKVDSEIDSMGLTIPINEVDTYLVVIRNQSLRDTGLTLAHEMVHVQQMARGILKNLKSGARTWQGRRYAKETKYMNQPWELMAFARQEIILRRALEE